MASAEADDGSEHVTDFLKRIKELGEQRDQEDTERTRKLEEQILEARRQREERRRERARSLSPDKQSPATPRTIRSPRIDAAASPLSQQRPPQSLSSALDNKPDLSPSKVAPPPTQPEPPAQVEEPVAPPSPPKPETSNSALPARAKTLSWQQRPSGLKGPRARPPAFLEKREPAKVTLEPSSQPSPTEEPSRADIAKSLSSKDSTWFRQTADRGANSAALRRNESESAESSPAQRRQLHGLTSRRATPDREESVPLSSATPVSESPSFAGSLRSKLAPSEADTSIMSESIQDNIEDRSEISTTSYRSHHRTESESTTGRRSAEPVERSGSPTKGMGGFVSSAMLRRTDSVNRRWNVSTGTSLSRHGSSAGFTARPSSQDLGHDSSFGPSRLDDTNTFKRPASRGQSSRPTSSHNNSLPQTPQGDDEAFVKPAPLDRSRSKTMTDPRTENAEGVKSPENGLSSSPSKRWSPTKSSWLESALSKPDTPKAKPTPPTQPAWMTNLQKTRQERQSKDLGKDSTASDLGRSSSLWGGSAKKEEPSKKIFGSTEDSEPQKTSTVPEMRPKPAGLSNGSTEKPTDHAVEPEKAQPEAEPEASEASKEEEATRHGPESATMRSASNSKPEDKPVPAPKPRQEWGEIKLPSEFEAKLPKREKPDTPPKKDFRSQLKPRSESPSKSQSNDLEFLNAAGKLRRADTKKYVAPDELGDNIRRGKAGLNITGGPAPRVRKDEFKDSLVEQKQRMKEKANEPGGKPPVPEKRQASIPEALRKRQALGQSSNSANVMNTSPVAKPSENKAPAQATSPTKSTSTENTRSLSPPTVSPKLAGRFNPAIASVLARGPPSPERSEPARRPSPSPAASRPAQEPSGSQPLEHKTKGRARGPKRRLPKAQSSSADDAASPPSPQARASPKPALGAKPAIRSSSRNVSINV